MKQFVAYAFMGLATAGVILGSDRAVKKNPSKKTKNKITMKDVHKKLEKDPEFKKTISRKDVRVKVAKYYFPWGWDMNVHGDYDAQKTKQGEKMVDRWLEIAKTVHPGVTLNWPMSQGRMNFELWI